MRTIRGLQITSIVVLSPVLLIMFSLISMLFSSIYSHITGYFISVHEQKVTIRNATDIQQYNSIPLYPIKKIRLFTRLRQSSLSSLTTIVICLYAIYVIFKKRTHQQQTEETSLLNQPRSKNAKKKASKRRKTKRQQQAKQRTRSNTVSSQEENLTVNTKQEQTNENNNNNNERVNVVSEKKQKTIEGKAFVNNHFFPSPTYSCVSTPIEKKVETIDLISPETTPSHSEDEEEEVQKKESNWYSPFSTGLDLDFLPRFNLMDPLCQYKIDFKYNTNIPPQHHYYHSHHHFYHPYFRNPFHSSQNVSCIQMLENHPFISSAEPHQHHHIFGPIGDRKK
ncbi:uncharacterized protein B0P05DRAFT_551549 [Gilbertella persicaria]|uniref:uncharacterized protein n=1 Tax=Gilbertella persicaria TaxID=101096 RepID=UPI00221FB8DB|nr:uncharacterized protein B0P05DRAFT_551549 [Gilbertella persicaria]KAI8069097.1 hypothetical protein B0P05DRAFT_551549 [Gilbertella persicaria]